MDENIQKEIEHYLQNEMSSKEKTLFEQRIEADAELKEDVFLQQSIHDVFTKSSKTDINQQFKKEEVQKIKTLLKSEEYQNIYANIKANTANYLEQKKNRFRPLMAIAAVFIAFITIIPFLENNSTQNYYAEYANWNDIPSYIEKGNTEKNLEEVEKNYKLKDYHAVIDLIHSLADTTKTKNPNLFIYLGASYFHQKNYDKALEVFNDFSQSDAYDSSKGYWYSVLVYLKQNHLEKAKKTALIIIENPNNYKYKEASELLKELE